MGNLNHYSFASHPLWAQLRAGRGSVHCSLETSLTSYCAFISQIRKAKSSMRCWKSPPRNRSGNVTHPLFARVVFFFFVSFFFFPRPCRNGALEPKSFWLLLWSNDSSDATCLRAVGQPPRPPWAFFIMAVPPGGSPPGSPPQDVLQSWWD